MNIYEKIYEKKKLNNVISTYLNISTIGKIKLELVPSKYRMFKTVPSVIIVDGKTKVPLNTSWTILLSLFLIEVKKTKGKEINKEDLDNIYDLAVKKSKKIYHFARKKILKRDLENMINLFFDISNKKENSKIEAFDENKFIPNMKAPYSVEINIRKIKSEEELPTIKFKNIIDICKKNCIPRIIFSGEEPTIRGDLIEIIEYAEDLTTVLNTDGVLLTKQYCDRLYNARLDKIFITLFSNEPDIHNNLSIKKDFEKTVQGIKNAVTSKLDVTVITPISKLNKNYLDTLKFIKEIGVKKVCVYNDEKDKKNKLGKRDYSSIIKSAEKISKEEQIEFEIKGDETFLNSITIMSDGNVISLNKNMGNVLSKDWKKIWNSDEALMLKYSSMKGGNKNEK